MLLNCVRILSSNTTVSFFLELSFICHFLLRVLVRIYERNYIFAFFLFFSYFLFHLHAFVKENKKIFYFFDLFFFFSVYTSALFSCTFFRLERYFVYFFFLLVIKKKIFFFRTVLLEKRKTMALPVRKHKIVTVLRSPHVDKRGREQFRYSTLGFRFRYPFFLASDIWKYIFFFFCEAGSSIKESFYSFFFLL